MNKRTSTTKDIGLLKQLHDQGQLVLAAEFQRSSVWPRPAKAYLIDTILNDRPIPLLFFQRVSSPQSGRPGYSVIDGQQRLRAVFEYLEDRFRTSASDKTSSFYNKTFSELPQRHQDDLLAYDLSVQELSGYSEDEIKDIFVRMNKYVVKLASQELRHAQGKGKFSEFVERIGKWDFWKSHRVLSAQHLSRMRAVEFAAELTILLIEGPQDKKGTIDLYYQNYERSFPHSAQIETRLKTYLEWIAKALPELSKTRYRAPTDLYSLVGALDTASDEGSRLSKLDPRAGGERLLAFDVETRSKTPNGEAARYVAAASRQTDNLQPRATRISILKQLLLES